MPAPLYSIFDSSVVVDSVQWGSYSLGVEFYVTQPMQVERIRYCQFGGIEGTHTGAIYRVSTGLQVSETVTFTVDTTPGWKEASLVTPFLLEPNVRYKSVVVFPDGIPYKTGYWTQDVISGPLVAVSNPNATNGQGSYTSGSGYPGNSGNGNAYGVDLVIGTPPATVPNPPTNLAAIDVSATTATVTWEPPATGSEPTSYEYSIDLGSAVDVGLVTELDLTSLQPNTAYSVRVRSVNAEGESDWSAAVSFTTTIINPPINLIASNILDVSATVTWEAPTTGPVPTSFEYRVDSGAPVNVGLDLDVDLTGLTPDTDHVFGVRSVNASGSSTWSEITISTTTSAPNPPTNLAVSEITGTGAKLTWDAPTTGEPPLRFEYSLNFGASVDLALAIEKILTGLQNGSEYSFRIRSVGEFLSSAWVEIEFSTVGAPNPPTGLTLQNPTSTSASVSWSPPASGPAVVGYEYSLNQGPVVDVGNVTVANLSGLTPNTSYVFRVRSIGAYGVSDWATLQFNTNEGPPDVPTNLSVMWTTNTKARIEWGPPSSGGNPQSYEYSLDLGASVNVGLNTHVIFEGLTPDTTYSIRVRAVNAEGSSLWVTTQFMTNSGPPNSPINLTASRITETTAFISWAPATTGPAVESYEYSLDFSAVTTSGQVSMLSLENMDPGSTHNIRVRSVGEYGTSTWTELTFTTTEPDIPPPTSKKLVWDAAGTRKFESGLDQGVLYLSDNRGVPWNGLTNIEEDLGDESTEAFYFDGVKFLDVYLMGDYSATIRAITYPDEFIEYEGFEAIGSSMYVDDQSPKIFGLSYRTRIGNDSQDVDFGYKIHLVYNLTAVPDTRSHQSVNSTPAPSEFGWNVSAVPADLSGYRPTAHVIIDSRYMHRFILEAFEEIIYGNETDEARLPDLQEIRDFIDNFVFITIIDHGDGTWSAIGPDEAITMLNPTTFEIVEADAVYLDEDTYTIESSS